MDYLIKKSNIKKILLILLLINFYLVTKTYAEEITSPFGWRTHPISGEWSFHTGVDIGYSHGTTIPAFKEGVVVFANEYGGYGYTLIISNDDGTVILYAHCSGFYVQEGEKVWRGKPAVATGNTGYSTGPHLHLELWENGEYVNPEKIFY